MGIEDELKQQTEKMLKNIREKRKRVSFEDSKKDLLNNLDAYISDTQHFTDKNDAIRAFEAVVYAWGILETLEHVGIIKENRPR